MKVLTKKQAQEIDRLSSEEFAIPSVRLMENAGKAAFQVIRQLIPLIKETSFLVVCGGGNNGGDGAVVARYLHQAGAAVSVCYFTDMSEKTGDKAVNYQRLLDLEVPLTVCSGKKAWKNFYAAIGRETVLIDALYGIGFRGKLDDLHQAVVRDCNNMDLKISLDIASGMPADTQTEEPGIIAHHTITFGAPKLSQIDYPGKSWSGKLHIKDIGFPEELMTSGDILIEAIDTEGARDCLAPRPMDSHKGTFGHVLVIGGHAHMTGAVKHAGRACLLSGAGLVTVSTVPPLESSFGSFPELMLFSHTEPGQILSFLEEKNIRTVLMGCGWGQGPEQEDLLKRIFSSDLDHLILDADALNLLCADKSISLSDCKADLVLTPHLKEFSRLTGLSIQEIKKDKAGLAGAYAKDNRCTLVLKDAVTVIGDPDGHIWFNSTGNDGLSKGGSGDILAGLLAGLMSSGHSSVQAAILSSWLLGKTAERVGETCSTRSSLPEDILEHIPAVFKFLESVKTK